jgi:cell division protease FtsH
VEECYAEAMRILQSHRDQLDRLARTLLARESLNEDEAYAAAGVARTTRPDLTSPTAVAQIKES